MLTPSSRQNVATDTPLRRHRASRFRHLCSVDNFAIRRRCRAHGLSSLTWLTERIPEVRGGDGAGLLFRDGHSDHGGIAGGNIKDSPRLYERRSAQRLDRVSCFLAGFLRVVGNMSLTKSQDDTICVRTLHSAWARPLSDIEFLNDTPDKQVHDK